MGTSITIMKRNFPNTPKRNNKNSNADSKSKSRPRRTPGAILQSIRADIGSGVGRRRRQRVPRGIASMALHPVAVKYLNTLTQPFHESVSACYVPNAGAKPSHKVTCRMRQAVDFNSSSPCYIWFAPAAANNVPSVFMLNSNAGVGTTDVNLLSALPVGVQLNQFSFTDLPYDDATLQNNDLQYRCVSAGVRITPTSGPSSRAGTYKYTYAHDMDGLRSSTTYSPTQMIVNSDGPHTRITSVTDAAPFEVTYGPFAPNSADDGWYSIPNTATLATSELVYAVKSQTTIAISGLARPVPFFKDIIEVDASTSFGGIVEIVAHYEFHSPSTGGLHTPSIAHPDVTHVTTAIAMAKVRHGGNAGKHFSEVAHSAMRDVLSELKQAANSSQHKLLAAVKTNAPGLMSAALGMLI